MRSSFLESIMPAAGLFPKKTRKQTKTYAVQTMSLIFEQTSEPNKSIFLPSFFRHFDCTGAWVLACSWFSGKTCSLSSYPVVIFIPAVSCCVSAFDTLLVSIDF